MALEIVNDLGKIEISTDVIANIAGGTVVESYGVVGMASKNQVRDGFAELLGKENYSRGVIVENNEGKLTIELYIIAGYGVKISEVASNVQTSVKYKLEKTLGLNIEAVNIHVQGVRIISTDE
ncbi:Asp23/Gls24 family envelope stress response protein [Jeotgalicoccus huakuii]|uniref:Asp23/Gls24 family envelope stress response protein n=1 Tax=Jeotgalicoccus TaxID=227979 RepID=UPI00040E026E|nr:MULTISPECIES: Asp23/Gls24 family envelope stress response protein [Jeotgalicoccus]MCK1977605.1 Asp23/Gls24 family envelope stress response protein [Jeotgalicoccus huakuii]QQD85756.1 Asp23/Gls24 family envelope stress response protein [Jeotgalicoccus sp. ATCC 8456]